MNMLCRSRACCNVSVKEPKTPCCSVPGDFHSYVTLVANAAFCSAKLYQNIILSSLVTRLVCRGLFLYGELGIDFDTTGRRVLKLENFMFAKKPVRDIFFKLKALRKLVQSSNDTTESNSKRHMVI